MLLNLLFSAQCACSQRCAVRGVAPMVPDGPPARLDSRDWKTKCLSDTDRGHFPSSSSVAS
eukprot:scaffold2602_cov177-Ochromonas_danica.AAC.2